jgi:hypothetical protein
VDQYLTVPIGAGTPRRFTDVEGQKVRLSAIGAVAVTFEEGKSGKSI